VRTRTALPLALVGVAVAVLVRYTWLCACVSLVQVGQEALRGELARVAAAETSFRASHGRYTADAAELGLAPHVNLRIRIVASDFSVHVVGTFVPLPEVRCTLHLTASSSRGPICPP